MRFDNPEIGRDAIACADHDDIARHQRSRRDGFMIALTYYHRLAGEHIADTLQRFFCVTFLNVTNQRVDHRHAQDDQRVHPVPHHRRQYRRRK
ncbi:hypothetical protein D3C78_900110 [compost metagenome]